MKCLTPKVIYLIRYTLEFLYADFGNHFEPSDYVLINSVRSGIFISVVHE